MPVSLRSKPPSRPHRAAGALAVALAVAGGPLVVAGIGQASASAAVRTGHTTGHTTMRVVAGPRRVLAGGHVWRADERIARGGHVVRITGHVGGDRPARLVRHARLGRFCYRVPVRPGVYRVRVDALHRTAHRHLWVRTSVSRHTVRGHLLTLHFAGHAQGITDVAVTRTTRPPRRQPGPTHPKPPAGTPPVHSTATVSPEAFGAVGDGVTDDTAALQNTFDHADGRTVVLPAGRVYAHTGVLYLRTAGLHVTGPGELLATAEATSSVWIEADDVQVDGRVVIATRSTTQRWSTWEQMGVRLVGHRGIALRDVTVEGSAAAGVYVGSEAHDFTLDHVTVRNTRADGIHMTEGSYDGKVIAPTVINSGDDGVAIVSYQQDGTVCHNIVVRSPVVRGTSGGRGLSVLGARNVTETGIDVESTSAAGIYIGSEGAPWYTGAATHVSIHGGRIVDANTDSAVDHGAVMVLSGEDDVAPHDITVGSLTIKDTRATASRDLGVITYGASPSAVLFRDITIRGGPQDAYSGNAPQSAYRLRTIRQNGVLLPDQG